jgi:hypothetical protein
VNPNPQDTRFRPWLNNLILAFYGAVTIGLAWYFLGSRGKTEEFLIAFALCSLFTVYQFKQFSRRYFGQRVEHNALKELQKLIDRDDTHHMQTNVPLPAGGDADALLSMDGIRFSLEIKSIESPDKVTSRHMDQAGNAGHQLSAIPVIWLPRAKRNQAREKRGVHIYAGNARSFVNYLERVR